MNACLTGPGANLTGMRWRSKFLLLLLLWLGGAGSTAAQRRIPEFEQPFSAPSAPTTLDDERGGSSGSSPRFIGPVDTRNPVGRYSKIGLGIGTGFGVLYGLNDCRGDCSASVLVSAAFFGFVGFGLGCSLDSTLDPSTAYFGCEFLNDGSGLERWRGWLGNRLRR